MKRFPAWLPMLLALAAQVTGGSQARAQSTNWGGNPPYGINLSWDDCGNAGALNKNFACDTDAGLNVLVGSVEVPETLPPVDAFEAHLFFETDHASISPWWHFEPGGCRASNPYQMRQEFGFPSTAGCMDLWGPADAGSYNAALRFGTGEPNEAEITVGLINADTVMVYSGTEYSLFRLSIANGRTLNCSGCSDGMCITFTDVLLYELQRAYGLSVPRDRNYVTWQGGGAGAGGICHFSPVPARKTTWGSIKAMYR